MPGRILVIDDEPQITRVLRAALSAQGYDVRTANDPEEGLRIFKDWPPDLVITDLMMPGISGVEVCRAIRAQRLQLLCWCCRCAITSGQRSKRSTPAPTTTSPSHSAFRNCWRASALTCGARLSALQSAIEAGDFVD